jgi:carbamate kinase
MRIVLALGGNALLRKGQKLTAENQRENVRSAVTKIVPLIDAGHDIVITHGSGPQIGLLALQGYAYKADQLYPLDVLDAQVEGMIGYVIGQELFNARTDNTQIATLLTQIEVDGNDPAFQDPTKPIGPFFKKEEAERLAKQNNWTIIKDKGEYRRVVPSPLPKKLVEAEIIKMLVDRGVVVICAGGGGIPVVRQPDGDLVGIEGVIDKDYASALLSADLDADMLMLLTDVDGVYENWGKPGQRMLQNVRPDAIDMAAFAAGSMRPKIGAACQFAAKKGKISVIGSIDQIDLIMRGDSGTRFESPAV